jgi:catecholate siderophore receptor
MTIRVKRHKRNRGGERGVEAAARRVGPHWLATGALVGYTVLGPRMPVPARAQAVNPGQSSGAATAESGSRPVHQFAIPAGALRDVLEAFRAATGVEVVLPPQEVGALPSPGVSGVHTAEQALRIALEGTGVGFRFVDPTRVALEVRLRESVEVTAALPRPASPKYTEPLRDVPQTLTLVPQAVIQEQNATTLRDVLRNVTGISIQAGEGGVPAGDNLSIRGFNARTDLFVDGVRDFGGYSRDPFNLEQVEVVKGPASSHAGRGATGGFVNLVSKEPLPVAARGASLGAGSDEYKRGTLDVNQPIKSLPGASFRLNGMWTDTDTPGRDVATSRRWGLAPSLALGLGGDTRLTLGYFHLDQDNVPDYGIPWVPDNNVPLAAFANQAAPVDFANFYGLRARDYEDTVTGIGSARLDRDFGGRFRLRNLLRYGRTERDSIITAPRFVATNSTDIRRTDWKSRDQTDTILANQADLTADFATGTAAHTVVAGLELAREASENFVRVETGAETGVTDLFRPNPDDAYTGAIRRNGARTDGEANLVGAYVTDTVKLGSRWQASGTLRFDRFSVDYSSFDAAGAATRFDRTDEIVSWRAGVVYKPRPEGSVYAGYGTSFNPSTEGLALSASTAEVAPERSRSFEVGTKWDLAGTRLSLSAAAFRTVKTNARTAGVNPGDPPTVLDGEHQVDGLELGVVGNPTRRLSLFGGYTFMGSEITRSNNAAEVGNEFGNTPRHSLSLWSVFRSPWDVEVGGGVRHVGDRFNNNSATRLAPGYWLVDAMAALRISDRLTLRLNANNLADERYIDRVGGGHFIPGEGRLLTLTTDFRF